MTIKKAADEKPKIDPLLQRPVELAYALIPDPANPERYFAVRLLDVVAARLEHLEPSGRSSQSVFGMLRMQQDMERRQRERKWRKP